MKMLLTEEKRVINLLKKIVSEQDNDLEKTVLNFLRRRSQFEILNYGDEEKPLKVGIIKFDFGDEKSVVNSFMKKSDVEFRILNILYESGLVEYEEFLRNGPNLKRQKIIRAIRQFLKEYPLFDV